MTQGKLSGSVGWVLIYNRAATTSLHIILSIYLSIYVYIYVHIPLFLLQGSPSIIGGSIPHPIFKYTNKPVVFGYIIPIISPLISQSIHVVAWIYHHQYRLYIPQWFRMNKHTLVIHSQQLHCCTDSGCVSCMAPRKRRAWLWRRFPCWCHGGGGLQLGDLWIHGIFGISEVDWISISVHYRRLMVFKITIGYLIGYLLEYLFGYSFTVEPTIHGISTINQWWLLGKPLGHFDNRGLQPTALAAPRWLNWRIC